MSDSLARALAAPAPAAQPMGNQDMLARILMGNPGSGLPQYPGMEQAAPMPMQSPENGLHILRRYGLAGMLTGGAASQAQAGEPAP